MFRPHKLLERQHQLQAQRRHEENLRHDYYQRTARYFERASEAAKQFTTWSSRTSDIGNDWLLKKAKEEKLIERRDKLKRLLEEENETFKRELEEKEKLKKNRRRSCDATISLEELRKRLIEAKMEQSLYYPRQCRKVRSFICSPNSDVKSVEFSYGKKKSDSDNRYSKSCIYSPNNGTKSVEFSDYKNIYNESDSEKRYLNSSTYTCITFFFCVVLCT